MEVSGGVDVAGGEPRRGSGCVAADCGAPTGIRCNYVDWRGTVCRTSWCYQHWVLVRGKPYCRRHATVMDALAADSAVGGLPAVESRAASLAGWMGRELEAPVRSALGHLGQGEDFRLISEPLRPALTPGAGRRWQRAWSLSDDSGVISRVCVEVEEHDEQEVVARVNGDVIGQGVPPWLLRHAGEAERRAFRDAIARSIEQILTGRQLQPVL